MKTLRRILIILAVFSILAGLMVTVVNASGANAPDFDAVPQFRPEGNGGGLRPEGDENRPERGEGGFGGSRWIFGLIKNVGVMAVLVTAVVWPKNIAKKNKRKAVMQASGDVK